MRLATLVLVLAAGCKAGTIADGDQPGLAKPVEGDRSQPLPGEGAASPTTAAEPVETTQPAAAADPSDTPAAANTEADDPWPATSSDPWAPTKSKDEVTATPALPGNTPATDPSTPARTDPWSPTKLPDKPIRRVPQPLH